MSDAPARHEHATRRSVLKVGGGGALALLIGGVAGWVDRRDGNDGAADGTGSPGPTTTSSTGTDPGEADCGTVIDGIGAIDARILVVGRAAVDQLGWTDLDDLLADVPDPDGDPLVQAAALTRDEFQRGDTVRIDGWVLARSEARAAAALALMDGAAAC